MHSRSLLQCVFIFFAAILWEGCASRPTMPPTHHWQAPDDHAIRGVANFGKVTPFLWRGAQPTAEGFRNLERAGVKTIISLRWDHDDLPFLKETKLKYLRIPMRAINPAQGGTAQLTLVLHHLTKLLQDPRHRPVFIHCLAGRDRTGYSVAAYRMAFEGWSGDDAIEEMFDYRFNRIFFRNPTFLRTLELDHLKDTLKKFP